MADLGKGDVQEEYVALTEATSLPDLKAPTPSRRSSFDDADINDYFTQRQQRHSLARRALQSLGLHSRSKTQSYMAAPRDELPTAAGHNLSRPRSRSARRCSRRSTISTSFKRLLIFLPIVILVIFGLLHILQVLIGRARLFWDVDADNIFLPHWGQHGYPGAGLVEYPTDATRDVVPIPCHSHNDYERRVPLFDALHWGCTGVEADVWLFDDELYVGHTIKALTRNRTFTAMYVDPLVDLLDRVNAATAFSNLTHHGVFDVDPSQTLVLLVDFKTKGHALFPVVSRQLQSLRDRDYLTYWDGTRVHSRAITVVGTGNTPYDMVVASQERRDIFFDAPLGRLWQPPPPPTSGDTPHALPRVDPDIVPPVLPSKNPDIISPRNSDIVPSVLTPSKQGQVGTELLTSLDAFNPATSYYASTSFRSAVGFLWRGHLSPRQMEILRGQIRGAQARGLKARYWDTPAWPISVRNHVWHVLMKEGADVLNADDLKAAASQDWRVRRHDWW